MYLNMSFLNWPNILDFEPPKTSIYSLSSLKGAFSNLVAGAFDIKNPKSMWIKYPSLFSKMLPLWRSLTILY